MKTPIVTLTTDWGSQNFFSGMVKGVLYSQVEGVQVVDVAHHVEPYNVMAATFVVKHSCLGFPPGTVHIIDVASNPMEPDAFVVVRARGQYFVCCNNGVPASALGDEVEAIVGLPLKEGGVYNFAAYSIFAPTAARLLNGTPMEALGPRLEHLCQRNLMGWVKQGEQYLIYIQYLDSYGNAYLGMSFREFEELRQGRAFSLMVRETRITEIMNSYYQQPSSQSRRLMDKGRDLCLTVSATGMLEIAIRMSHFAPLFGLKLNATVLLEFKQ